MAIFLSDYHFIDLTQTVVPDIPNWDGGCGFESHTLFAYDLEARTDETVFLVQSVKMVAGIGTHVDSPAHCCPGKAFISDIALEQLIAPCLMIDISTKVIDDTYLISIDDIHEFEVNVKPINMGDFVIFRTGWESRWSEGNAYRNDLKFPSVSEAVSLYLIEKGVVGIGIETLSPDCAGSGFPVHRHILGAGKYIVENLSNLSKLPTSGGTVFVMPLKLGGCTEAPARVIVAVKHEEY